MSQCLCYDRSLKIPPSFIDKYWWEVWVCPNCGKTEGLTIDNSKDGNLDADEFCDELHEHDVVFCCHCEGSRNAYRGTGKDVQLTLRRLHRKLQRKAKEAK